jgi:hypothetical protein
MWHDVDAIRLVVPAASFFRVFMFQRHYYCLLSTNRGPDSSVGIATDYGLDGPGI